MTDFKLARRDRCTMCGQSSAEIAHAIPPAQRPDKPEPVRHTGNGIEIRSGKPSDWVATSPVSNVDQRPKLTMTDADEMRRILRDIGDILNAEGRDSANPFIAVRDMSDEIDRLRAEVERLREVLRDAAELIRRHDLADVPQVTPGGDRLSLAWRTLSGLRRVVGEYIEHPPAARDALDPNPNP